MQLGAQVGKHAVGRRGSKERNDVLTVSCIHRNVVCRRRVVDVDAVIAVPLVSQPNEVKMDYRITMGVRFNEPEWKRDINDLLKANKAEIEGILLDYGVPLLDEQGNPIAR